MKTWTKLCKLMSRKDLNDIANADYGIEVERNPWPLCNHSSKNTRHSPLLNGTHSKYWRLTRWEEVNTKTAGKIAFSTFALLVSSFHPKSNDYHLSINENIIILIECAKIS